jgi:Predicted membrane protein
MDKKFFTQLVKYGIVGVSNTLVTAIVIWLIMHFVYRIASEGEATSWQLSVSNFIGYAAGVINSFIWNRNWTFKSKNNWKKEFLVFVGLFILCYIPQLILINLLNTYAHFPTIDFTLFGIHVLINHAYSCQLIGIVFFTLLNFVCNKYITFKRTKN